MTSGWNITTLRNGRLVRVIAILFLFHTGIDLLFPQFCNEEPVNITVNQSLLLSNAIKDETSAVVPVSLPSESGEDGQSDPPAEDCFCCCAHIVPGTVTVSLETSDASTPGQTAANLSIPSRTLPSEYRPPRFA